MKIGILETGPVDPDFVRKHGDYPAMLEDLVRLSLPDVDFETFTVMFGEFPTTPNDADGWIITGSRFGAYEDHPWIKPLENLIREIVSATVPLFGVCFGHQIIAQALGGTVVKSEKGWGLGVVEYKLADAPSWMKIPSETFSSIGFHQDQVVEAPASAVVFATNDFCPNAGLVYGQNGLDAFTIQPHPEFGHDFTADLIASRSGSVLPVEVGEKALETLHQPVDRDVFSKWIAAYFTAAWAAKKTQAFKEDAF